MKTCVVSLLALVLLIIAVSTAGYLSLEKAGQFSPRKCEEKGGRWDEAVELCRYDD